ncbi:MAG: phosphoribosylamine--glycine ligase [Promethearchaeota archaeon]
MVKVLLIGNGAREHAIAEALVDGGAELKAFMNKKNPGIAKLTNEQYRIDDLENFQHAIQFGRDCDFAVVGPEAPLVVGIANAFESAGIPLVGPTIQAAQLEGSKIFTRELLKKHDISTNIEFSTFFTMDDIPSYIDEIGLENVVVKPDGLTGGKGVKVFGEHLHSKDDVLNYCQEIVDRNGRVIIEEKLDGEEFTLQTFVDGSHIVGTPLVQDHKRAFENDEGPNTGGMGSYSMADHLMPFIDKSDVEQALNSMKETIDALKKDTGINYKGFLYGQFMKVKNGIKLVEFNVRFGDPEAMNVLPLLETSFVDICQAIIKGNLNKLNIQFQNKATVVKYIAPDGYPTSPKANEKISVDAAALSKLGVRYYFASVNQLEDGSIVTSTSRTMGILGIADSLEDAEKLAEQGTSLVSGKLFHRKDIGTQALLQKRVDHMKKVMNGT